MARTYLDIIDAETGEVLGTAHTEFGMMGEGVVFDRPSKVNPNRFGSFTNWLGRDTKPSEIAGYGYQGDEDDFHYHEQNLDYHPVNHEVETRYDGDSLASQWCGRDARLVATRTTENGRVVKRYDREGYDDEGYDWLGYDEEGYDREGYDADGWNDMGWSKDGYNIDTHDLYDDDGLDCNGLPRDPSADDCFAAAERLQQEIDACGPESPRYPELMSRKQRVVQEGRKKRMSELGAGDPLAGNEAITPKSIPTVKSDTGRQPAGGGSGMTAGNQGSRVDGSVAERHGEKTIHVDEYTRGDGTKVSAHDKTIKF